MNAICSFRLCKLTDIELIEKFDRLTDQMYKDHVVPTRHIPAQPDNDYDLLAGELILRYADVINREKQLLKEPISFLRTTILRAGLDTEQMITLGEWLLSYQQEDNRDNPCPGCENGELGQVGYTKPNGQTMYECDSCGYRVSYP